MISHRLFKLLLIASILMAQILFGVARCNNCRHECIREEPCVRRQLRCQSICPEVFIAARPCNCEGVEDSCSRQCPAPCQACEEQCRESFRCRSSAPCLSTSECRCQQRCEEAIDCPRCGATLPCRGSAACPCCGCCLNECRSPCQEPSPCVASICGCERSSCSTPCESNYASTSCECGCQRSPSCQCP